MKILHICTYDIGGAGIAAIRLHKRLLSQGIESKILVLIKKSKTPLVYSYGNSNKFKRASLKIFQKLGFLHTQENRQAKQLLQFKKDFEIFSFSDTSYKSLAFHSLITECDIVNL